MKKITLFLMTLITLSLNAQSLVTGSINAGIDSRNYAVFGGNATYNAPSTVTITLESVLHWDAGIGNDMTGKNIRGAFLQASLGKNFYIWDRRVLNMSLGAGFMMVSTDNPEYNNFYGGVTAFVYPFELLNTNFLRGVFIRPSIHVPIKENPKLDFYTRKDFMIGVTFDIFE